MLDRINLMPAMDININYSIASLLQSENFMSRALVPGLEVLRIASAAEGALEK